MATYSHSRLEAYRNCPRQYKLRYIDRVPEGEKGIEAFMGSRVHEVLERLYGGLAKEHRMTLEDALAYYDLLWEQKWHDEVKVVNADYTAENYRETGRRCIRDYWHRYEPFDQGIVIGIERKVRFELDGERGVVLQGYVDRIDRVDDGVFEIHDYKTGAFVPEQNQADADPQLALYQLALEEMWPEQVREVVLVWHYLASDMEIRSKRGRDSLEQLRAETLARVDLIEADTEFEPAESNLCDWCGYQELCPRKKHLVAVEKLPPREFHADDGVKLVDDYVRLTERKAEALAELDEQIETIKEDLIAFAESNGLEVIAGSEYKVTVKPVSGVTVPRKGSDERARLEEAIKAAGKWDEVSCLDASALAKAVRDVEWDVGICGIAGEFLTACETHRITKSRLRPGGASD